MGLREDYEELRTELLTAVGESAQSRDTGRIATLGRLVEETDRAIAGVETLEEQLANLRERLRTPSASTAPLGEHIAPQTVGRKEYGDRKRRAFARSHRLQKIKGVLYRTGVGARVGIATATERIRNKWFLGLPDAEYDCAVLICEHDGHDLEFVLPAESLKEIWPHLSREKRTAHVKLHVKLVEDNVSHYELRLLGGEVVDLRPYAGNFGPFA